MSLAAVASLGAALIAAGFSIWLALAEARRRGRAEAEIEQARQTAQNAHKAGTIIAEHRDPENTAGRLDRGSF